MELHTSLVQKQTQRLMLTPKMQQALKVLQLSTLELDVFLRQELTENPTLEEREEQAEEEQPEKEESEDGSEKVSEPDNGQLGDQQSDDSFVDAWNDYYYEGKDFSRPFYGREDTKRAFIENTLTRPESLASHLTTQLRLSVDDPEELRIGEWVIGEIDDRGYFTGEIQEGVEVLDVTEEDIQGSLDRIQLFDPLGVGGRNVQECLEIQLYAMRPHDSLSRKIIREHWKEFEKRQFTKIASALSVSVEDVLECADFISTLDPWPGRKYSGETAPAIIPDVIVTEVDGEYVVMLNDDNLPRLRISSHYRNMLKNGRLGKEEAQYIRQKFNSARWFIKNIEQRKSTIYKVTCCIMDLQHDFLDKGASGLKPLTLQDIASRVEMHESTISRVTNNKYVQTPQGIFELKYFFSSSIRTDGGESASALAVKDRIRRLIENELKTKPLSDQKIANILKREGYNIARRTVTKYREALNILPSKLRKQYE